MASRRTKGLGSITQLPNGRYRVRVETTPVDGKRQWLSRVCHTKTEATKALKELSNEKETLTLIATNRPKSLQYYLEDYIESRMAQGARQSTCATYKQDIGTVAKALGDIPLNQLTTGLFEELMGLWRDQGLKEKTIKDRLHRTANMLDWCVYKGYTKTNILAYFVRFTKKLNTGSSKKQVVVLSEEEHKTLKEVSKTQYDHFLEKGLSHKLNNVFYPVYLLTYETGMRVGEVAALRWDNIDFETNTVHIDSTKIKGFKGFEQISKFPKSDAGNRSIVISRETVDVLKAFKETYKSDVVFVFSVMRKGWIPFNTNTFRDAFKDFLEAAGITRHFTFHDIRHTNASLMIHKGVPLTVVAQRLGHADVSVTLKVYAHIINECKEQFEAVIKA